MAVKVIQKTIGQKKDWFRMKPVFNDLKAIRFSELFLHIISCEVHVLLLRQQLL